MVKFLAPIRPGDLQFGLGLTTDELAQLQRRELVLPLPAGTTELLIFCAPTQAELDASLLRSDVVLE